MKQELGNLIAEDPQQETINLFTYRLNAVTEQRDGLKQAVDCANDLLASVTEQRDRLAEAMRQMRSSGDIVICSQSATNLTTNTQTQPKLIHNGVGIADMYSREEFEIAMKRTNQTIVSDEATKQNTKNLS